MNMSKETTKVTLSKEACYCGIPDFYRNVAAAMGVTDFEGVSFNCTRICVSKPIQDAIFAYYKEEHQYDDVSIAMLWVNYGPKASLPDSGYVAETEEDFIAATLPF